MRIKYPLLLRRFIRDASGGTSVEYALIAVIISVGVVAGVTEIRGAVRSLFEAVANGFPDEP